MATSTFLARSHAYPASDLSFGGFSAMPTSTSSSNSSRLTQHISSQFPSQRLPLLTVSNKLPSLEGLLKKMQDEPASPPRPSRALDSPAAQSLADFSERAYAQHHGLSPAGRETTQMPSLRTIISPSMAKSATIPAHSSFLHAASFPLGVSHQHMTFASRKRSWMDTNSAVSTEGAVLYPTKERAVSPVSTTATSSSGPHRSRASKYCKIEGCERVSQRNNLCHSHGGKRLCKEDGCSSKDRGNGYCIKHGGGKICSMESCEKKARRKGLCTQHFRVNDDESPENMSSLQYNSIDVTQS